MGIFDRIFNRSLKPSTSIREVRRQPGPMTAHEAWALVRPRARELDARARWTFVTSGLDISREGRSFTWEFLFELPKLRAQALLSLEPAAEAGDPERGPIVLVERINPVSGSGTDPKDALPESFRDSPEVIAEFSAGGVDFVAGPTDMKLEGRRLKTGKAVWVTWFWDEERTVAFSREGP